MKWFAVVTLSLACACCHINSKVDAQELPPTSVTLAWDFPTGSAMNGATKFNIYRDRYCLNKFTKIGVQSIDIRSYIDSEVLFNTCYQYRVTSQDESGNESDPTNVKRIFLAVTDGTTGMERK